MSVRPYVTPHACDRYRERFADNPHATHREIVEEIVAIHGRGVPWGGAVGTDWHVRAETPDGETVVLAMARGDLDGRDIVKTVLDLRAAEANQHVAFGRPRHIVSFRGRRRGRNRG